MKSLNILVTGANGFIGRTLLQALGETGHNIFALDQQSSPEVLSQFNLKKFYHQDLTGPFQLEESFDYVFHLAALNVTHVGSADAEAYHRVNVLGTEHLLKSAKIDRFVFMSTAKVYQVTGQPIDENSPIDPQKGYEKSKWLAENVCHQYLPDDRLIIVRPVNIVGPGQSEKALVPVFLRNAVAGLPLNVFAPKETMLQLLFVDDVVAFLKLIWKRENVSGIFNLVGKERIRMDQLVEMIMALTGSASKVQYSNLGEAKDPEVLARRAREALGWQPQVTVAEMLQRCYREYQKS